MRWYSEHLNLPVIRLDFHERTARSNHLHPIIRQDLLRTPCPLDPLVDDALKPTRPSTLWSIYSRPSTTNVLIVGWVR